MSWMFTKSVSHSMLMNKYEYLPKPGGAPGIVERNCVNANRFVTGNTSTSLLIPLPKKTDIAQIIRNVSVTIPVK